MKPFLRRCRGYSLIELLVVLVIVGILAMVGVTMLGNRPSGSVRTIMDELEGTIAGAQKLAVATGHDILLATQGDWGGPPLTPMLMAYGEAALGGGTILSNGQNRSESFRVGINAGGTLQREHMYAGVVTVGNADWWATAQTGSADITRVSPFKDAVVGPPLVPADVFNGILSSSSTNLFQGGSIVGSARISGANKRFTTTFWIEVVSLRDGAPLPGGPMGLLVVSANGGQIYKFYNPGIRNGGDGTWRRI